MENVKDETKFVPVYSSSLKAFREGANFDALDCSYRGGSRPIEPIQMHQSVSHDRSSGSLCTRIFIGIKSSQIFRNAAAAPT